MARLILFLTLLGGLAIAAVAAFAALQSVSLQKDANGAPLGLLGAVRMIAFIFLFVLTTGVSTGLLGAD